MPLWTEALRWWLRRRAPSRAHMRAQPMREEKASAVGGLIALHGPRQPVWTPRDYESLAEEAYGRNAVAFRCVRMIAEAAASVPFRLCEHGRALTEHPLLALLMRPNPADGPVGLLESWYGFLEVSGNAYLEAVSVGGAVRGLPFDWRYGPRDVPLGDFAYQTARHGFAAVGLKPLAPVHVRLVRQPNDDIALTWVRRTRIGGDAWDAPDVPLGESREVYEVDIVDGADVVRTLAVATPSAIYSAADQIADFGAPPSTLTVRVHQLSDVVGRGTAREVTRNV